LFREPSEEGERENKSCTILIAENRVCIQAGFAKRVFPNPAKKGRENELLYISWLSHVCIRAGFVKRVISKSSEEGERE
jgi:hypothetical protein